MNAWTITFGCSVLSLLYGTCGLTVMLRMRAKYFAGNEYRADQALGVAPPPFPVFHSILLMIASIAVIVVLYVSYFTYN